MDHFAVFTPTGRIQFFEICSFLHIWANQHGILKGILLNIARSEQCFATDNRTLDAPKYGHIQIL